jgi:hypothetical protein
VLATLRLQRERSRQDHALDNQRGKEQAVSDGPRRLVTEEQREQAFAARRYGGTCSAYLRPLAKDETVYWQVLTVDITRLVDNVVKHYATTMETPVGVECAAPGFLNETAGRDPAQCAGCGRPVYYDNLRPTRHRALCSRHCARLADKATRSAGGRS